jgi:xanthine dehydrogenase accessory factor
MKNLYTWKLIANSLQQDIPVMLLYVLQSSGSSPGRQGFFMAVTAEGEMEGSIGGGIMEHKFVELAKESLKTEGTRDKAQETRDKRQEAGHKAQDPVIRKQIHDKSVAKDQSGMICSGEQSIFLYPVKQTDGDAIQRLVVSLENNKNGTLQLSPAGITFLETSPANEYHFTMRSEYDWEYEEKTGYQHQLFIIGSGHCALALCKLMRSMDFYIRVYEDRPGLNTFDQNEFAHEKIMVNDYAQLQSLISSGHNHYVVVMTFGYRTDDIAVRALLDKEFAWFGLLGSRNKTLKMLEGYKKEGIAEHLLQRIQAPAGLAIRSQTPEEIAVSIAAQIIEVKNKNIP